mgnify:CR=1 FL=1
MSITSKISNFPEYAKDIKLNYSKILNEPTLNKQQLYGIILISSITTKLDDLVEESISIEVLILSVLTQAQDAMLEGQIEKSSQFINRSKYMLHELASSKIIAMFATNRLKN